MSTGKRLAKRSIIGTRVCAPAEDGKFYSGVIQSVKSPAEGGDADTRYSVRFDAPIPAREFTDQQLIGPGFQTVVSGIRRLVAGQRVYLTYNGREVSGEVSAHDPEADDVRVCIQPPGQEAPLELRKRLDELRLLESRKSARLMDQDTDFARLADMAGDRKRPAPSHSIDVPTVHGSRKRRPSSSHDDPGIGGLGLDFMDECTAALVLMSLSCSPHSPHLNGWSSSSSDAARRGLSPSPSASDGGSGASASGSGGSWRSATPSPPLSDGSSQGTSAFWAALAADEGIGLDDDELPRKRKTLILLFPYRFSLTALNVS
ncbi:Uncharacterized protein GBIM_06329 [Gryllus bimaculatus]|nr:Uncharacterized protein GBIM_06329 [Gryllus bimaculatus]